VLQSLRERKALRGNGNVAHDAAKVWVNRGRVVALVESFSRDVHRELDEAVRVEEFAAVTRQLDAQLLLLRRNDGVLRR